MSDREALALCKRIEDLHAGRKLKSTWAGDVLDIAHELRARIDPVPPGACPECRAPINGPACDSCL